MKEKKTKRKARKGHRLWMFPKQAEQVSVDDTIKITSKIFNQLTKKEEDK